MGYSSLPALVARENTIISANPSLFVLNFGPAHPAAHGVFRLLTSLNSELVLHICHSQGLLWRSTENLVEYRNPGLVSGYFARMDYVSFVSQELGFSTDKSRTSIPESLIFQNFVLNHLLNVACTVADSGALGAIL